MRIFVTGATGFIGSALVADLLAHGHQVTGLARSAAAADKLRTAGAEAQQGSLRDPGSLKRAAAEADGVIHLAFTFSPAEMPLTRTLGVFLGGPPNQLVRRMMAAVGATDRAAIDALGAALQGSGRPLVTTFGLMGLAGPPGERAGRPASEADQPNPRSPAYTRSANEAAVQAWAARGVRASVIRLAPSVHGEGDKGLVPQIAAAARKQGAAPYIADGVNRWCGVHRADAATLFRLALEKGRAGGVYHGVGDAGMPFRSIAQIIGDRFKLPVKSITQGDAAKQMGWIAPFAGMDNPAVSTVTQSELGWSPQKPTLAEDLTTLDYFRLR